MSDAVQISLIGGVVSVLITVFGSLMSFQIAKLNKKADEAKQGVQEVAIRAEAARVEVKAVAVKLDSTTGHTQVKLDALKAVADTTHRLVNSQAIALAKLYATSTRRVAELTKDHGDIRVAEDAEKVVGELIKKQEAL